MKTSKVPLVDLLTLVSRRCEEESELYPAGSMTWVCLTNFIDDLGTMVSTLKSLEESQKA
jgi:hypothetical protein